MSEVTQSENVAKAGEVFRLENLEVKEVSLVTRPANKRTFAIVKSEEGVVPAASEPAPTVIVDASLLTEQTKQADPLVSPAAEAYQELHPTLASALPQVGPLVKRAETALEGLTAGKFGVGDTGVKNFAGEMFSIAQSFSMLAVTIDPTRPPENNYAVQLADLHAKEAADKQLSDEVNKAGAKMAKERLARMKDAVNILLSLVEELTQEEAALPGVFNNAEKAVTPSEPVRAVATPTTKDDGLASKVNTLDAEVASLKKSIAERDAMLAQLAKTRGISNALPVDGPTAQKQPEAPIAWGFDLNGAQARGKVRPEHTFGATAANGKEQ